MAAPPVMTDTQRLYKLQEFFGYMAVRNCSSAIMDIARAVNPPADQEPIKLEDSEALLLVAEMYERLANHFAKVRVTPMSLLPRNESGKGSITPFDTKGRRHVFRQLTDARIGLELLPNDDLDGVDNNRHYAANKLKCVVNELLAAMVDPQDLTTFPEFKDRIIGYITWMSDYVTCLTDGSVPGHIY